MKVEGKCHCGEITFEAEIDPEAARICHCTDCQILTGAAYRVKIYAAAPKDTKTYGLRVGTLERQ